MSAVALIEVTVCPTKGCTLVESEEHAYWVAVQHEPFRRIVITADDVASVLANPLGAVAESLGYGRLWVIRAIDGTDLEMRTETPEDDES